MKRNSFLLNIGMNSNKMFIYTGWEKYWAEKANDRIGVYRIFIPFNNIIKV